MKIAFALGVLVGAVIAGQPSLPKKPDASSAYHEVDWETERITINLEEYLSLRKAAKHAERCGR